MTTDLRDELKAEYTLLQGQYEGFDARALTIKSWAATLLTAGVAAGVSQKSITIICATILAALCLWLLEAIWKSFQYCYTDRIKLIEKWFRGEYQGTIVPFQIFSAWGEVWHRHFKYPRSIISIMMQPFVCIPYVPICIFGLIAARQVWVN